MILFATGAPVYYLFYYLWTESLSFPSNLHLTYEISHFCSLLVLKHFNTPACGKFGLFFFLNAEL